MMMLSSFRRPQNDHTNNRGARSPCFPIRHVLGMLLLIMVMFQHWYEDGSVVVLLGGVTGFVPITQQLSSSSSRQDRHFSTIRYSDNTIDGGVVAAPALASASAYDASSYEQGSSFSSPSSASAATAASTWSQFGNTNLEEGEEDATTMSQVDADAEINVLIEQEDTIWVQDDVDDMIDEIHNAFSTLDKNMYDVVDDTKASSSRRGGTDSISANTQLIMDDEIAMLIRCNEQPDSLLVEEGRAIVPLTPAEQDDITQLVHWNEHTQCYEATEFLQQAVSTMFHTHATTHAARRSERNKSNGSIKGLCMDRVAIAAWMTKSLKHDAALQEQQKVSQHDKRVAQVLSSYGKYGTGRLLHNDLQRFYVSCIIDPTVVNNKHAQQQQQLTARQLALVQRHSTRIDAVWRDIRAHGIISPNEEEYQRRSKAVAAVVVDNGAATTNDPNTMIVDECEILDWGVGGGNSGGAASIATGRQKRASNSAGATPTTTPTSSHMMVELAKDNKTPLRLRDGDFVFIDEESCIGCTYCSLIAQSSFSMLDDSGRARTYQQRPMGKDVKEAIDACPVSCMHRVSFDELKQLETYRDDGDGRTDHKHLGHRRGHIPLHVANRDSDMNHRSSWYHTTKAKCVQTGCDKSACYDCPTYGKGKNPNYIAKHQHAEHVRAQEFLQNGEIDNLRHKIEL